MPWNSSGTCNALRASLPLPRYQWTFLEARTRFKVMGWVRAWGIEVEAR